MTEWFARPILSVADVEASLRFYIDRLGFTSPWQYDENGKVCVAQVDRQGCKIILADNWPEKIGKGTLFISLNVSRRRAKQQPPRWTNCAQSWSPGAFRSKRVSGATGSWSSTIPRAISSSSTIRPRLNPARQLERAAEIASGRDSSVGLGMPSLDGAWPEQ